MFSLKPIALDHAKHIIRCVRKWLDEGRVGRPYFIWHGGEPTLLPLKFYRSIVREQDRCFRGVPYANYIQTNLSVPLSDDYIKFLADYSFNVGFSYDVINSARDPDRCHTPIILKNLFRLMRCTDVPPAYAVVTPHNVDYPELIFDFFSSYGIDFRLSVAKPYKQSKKKLCISVGEYCRFMERMFHVWRDFGFGKVMIANFVDAALALKKPGYGSVCHFHENCEKSQIHVAMNGDVYPCDHLVDQPRMKYGNIYDGTFDLSAIVIGPVFDEFSKRREAIRKICRQCEYYKNCFGGCINDSIRFYNSYGRKSWFCAYYHKVFPMVKPYIGRIIETMDRDTFKNRLPLNGLI